MNDIAVQLGHAFPISVTPIYAGLLGLFLIFLSARVIALRGNPLFRFLSAGRDEEGKMLKRAIRAQGNFIEYTPFFLILLLLTEMGGVEALWLHMVALVFLTGRLMHGIGFAFTLHNPILRVGGIGLTLVALGVIAIMVLFV